MERVSAVQTVATLPKDEPAAVIFRPAKLEEDDVLSRILCNAFLPIWYGKKKFSYF